MPLVIKPRTLALLHKVERRRVGARFIVTVLAAFDLTDSRRLDGEQALWTMAASTLPEGCTLDVGMPKPRGEMLIGGRVQASDAHALMLEARMGTARKRLAVFGDRWWMAAHGRLVASEPRPLHDLLLSPTRAFGGAGHAGNAAGIGFGAQDLLGRGEAVPLPNIENPDMLIGDIADLPEPAAFGPIDVMDPRRQHLAGTYDAAWLRNVAPALADDIHPEFFMVAPPEQRVHGYIAPDEPYALANFSSAAPLIEGRLPGILPRAFIGQRNGRWSEMDLSLDTVWFLAGARRGVLVWHGVVPVEDIDGKDVSDVMLAYEQVGAPPRSIEHYAEVRRLRSDPESGPRYAFSEWQLTPVRDPAEREARLAARRTAAAERAALQAEGMAFLTNRALDEAGIPEALRPPPPQVEVGLPLPTAQEVADGDFDLGDVLDILEAKSKEAQEAMRQAAETGKPVLDAMTALHAPGAGPRELDALFAAIPGETGLAASLDATLGGARVLPPDLPEGMTVPPEMAAALDGYGDQADWRSQILNALPAGDDDTLLAEARARYLRQPEVSPLAPVREALDRVGDFSLPPLPADLPPPPEAAPPPENPLAAVLGRLGSDPDIPAAEAGRVQAQLFEADQRLGAAFPNLKAAPGTTNLDALLASFGPPPADGPVDPQEKLAALAENAAAARKAVDAVEPELEQAEGEARRRMPSAGYPQTPMPARISKRFGDLVLQDIRDGMDMRGRDLAGIDLAGADLSGIDLTGALLERANLANTRLVGANLSQATLAEARLEQADLTDAELFETNLCGINGRGMTLSGARLTKALVMEANLAGSIGHGAVWDDVRLLDVNLAGADFCEARFAEIMGLRVKGAGMRLERAMLRQCQFLECDLSGARLSGAFLDRCAFLALVAPQVVAVSADLRGTAFIGEAKLAGSDFSDALVNDAGFFAADLRRARFRRAICERTLFNEAKLEGADFHLSSLRRALLDATTLAGADFVGAQLMEAQLHRADLTGAQFHRANLYGADLTDANLIGADFTGANLENSILALETADA